MLRPSPRLLLPALLLLAGLPALAAPPPRPPTGPATGPALVGLPPPQAVNLAVRARAELDSAEALLSQVQDAELRGRIAERLARSRALLLEIEGQPAGVSVVLPFRDGVVVVPGGTVPDAASPPRPKADPRGIAPADFDALLASVAGNSFASQQLKLLRAGSAGQAFTVAQVMALMRCFSFGRDQVEAALMLHPKVVDPENWPQVYGVFTFSTDATRLQERLAGG